MNTIRQIIAVTLLNLRNIPARLGSSLVAIVGVAAVVGVFAGVLSMSSGFQKTMVSAGNLDTAVIVRAGSTGELASALSSQDIQIISTAPGVKKNDGVAAISGELYVVVDVEKKSTSEAANVPLRGVDLQAFDIRNHLEITEGRIFETGRNELVAGRGAAGQFKGLEVGKTIMFGNSEWTVVGIFEDAGGVSESELWADVRVLQSAYQRGNAIQSARVKLDSAEAINDLKAALDEDPRINVDVTDERTFYSEQSRMMTRLIEAVGYPITILMAIGAIFGALNTMYSSISNRGKEIATLRAIGFRPLSILFSVVVESSVLALLGGIIGGGLAWLFLNGFTVSTLNAASFSQVVFDFAVTPDLLTQGIIAALIIGVIGGLFPAIRAVRQPVTTALREQ